MIDKHLLAAVGSLREACEKLMAELEAKERHEKFMIGWNTAAVELAELKGRLEEREACAKVCDDKHDYMCSRAAAEIRARGNNA